MPTLLLIFLTAIVAVSQETERTLPFTRLQTPPQMAEAATVIRSIGDIRDLHVDAAQRTMTVRGDTSQTALADWLFPRLDRVGSATPPDSTQLDYRPTSAADDIVRVLYFRNSVLLPELHQMVTVIRSLTEIRRAFLSTSAEAFVMRGTQNQLDAARWLIEALDQPAANPVGTGVVRIADANGEDTIRLFSLARFNSEQELKSFATELRAATDMRRVFTYYPRRAIAVRSTPAQVEKAARLVDAR